MHTARAVLDEQDRKAANPDQPSFEVRTRWLPDQPPFEKRTPWLFECLEELALPGDVELFVQMKVSRIRGDMTTIGRLVDQVHAGSKTLEASVRHQRQQICGWIKDQIKRETGR
jgi:hypothetical protein